MMKKNIILIVVLSLCQLQAGFPHGGHSLLDDEAIRSQRAMSNQAIAAQDVEAIIATLMPDYHVVTAANLQLSGLDAQRKMIAKIFTETPDASYVRTPEKIQVNLNATEAAETGNWTGQWTKQGRTLMMRGSYFAKWRKVDGHWLIQAEVFVAL